MEHYCEIDWIAAYYGNFELGDSTINFWLTATFAVIVAIHALGGTATITLSRLIAFLYTLFSVYSGVRYWYLVEQFEFVANRTQELVKSGTFGYGQAGIFLDIMMCILFIGGSLATIIFVLTAPRRMKLRNAA